MTDTAIQEATGATTLPASWEWAAYRELGEWSGGGTPSKANSSYWEDGSVPWFSPKDMRGLELHDSQDHITEAALQGSAAKPIRAGSLLFVVRSGILRRTLPVALTAVDGAVNQDIKVLTPSKSLSTKYLLYATLAQKEEIRHRCKKAGTTVESIQVAALQEYRLPIAPLNEQRRIVEKIEELFTKLDAGVRSLERARAQLKSYRRSVLKAAAEGELSREWREAHKDELEPASELLKRILQERRERFTGKKYKGPVSPDPSQLPTLPDRWAWATLPQLGELNRGKSKHRPRNAPFLYGGPYPFIQTGDIREAEGTIRRYKQSYTEEGLNQSRLWPEGTLCITIAANIAETALLGFEACFPDSVVGFLPDPDHCSVAFVEYFMRTARERLNRYAPATAQKNINLQTLNGVAVPLPPLQEQHFIVEQLDRSLSVITVLEATVGENLKQAAALRQSILKQAFSGELVPQDPDDEPASALLERIREERLTTGQKLGQGRRARAGSAGSGPAEQRGLF